MADLLSATGDPRGALHELSQAAAEGPVSAALSLGLRVVSSRLPATETDALRTALRAARAVPPSRRDLSVPSSSSSLSSSPTSFSSHSPSPSPSSLAKLPEPTLDSLDPQPPLDPIEQAFASLQDAKPVRSRRLGEDVARRQRGPRSPHDPLPIRLDQLVTALERAGAKHESLRLGRTLLENDDAEVGGDHDFGPDGEKGKALLELLARAERLGAPELAAGWRADMAPVQGGRSPAFRLLTESTELSDSDRFRRAQRMTLLAELEGRGAELAIAHLWPLLGGHPGAPSALALSERLCRALGPRAPVDEIALVGAAYDAERSPRRRQRLALSWVDRLKGSGDLEGALAVLHRAIEELPPDASMPLRRARAELLRAEGREGDLSRAISSDAQLAELGQNGEGGKQGQGQRQGKIGPGPTGGELRVDLARLLEGQGALDSALEVRLQALVDAPGDLTLLAPARQRLEALGQLERSLELAVAALPHLTDRLSRAGLLRDIATLAEATTGDRQRAASAWLEVLSLCPDDAMAWEAGERLFRQIDDRERLANLLSWRAAREVEPAARAKVLWRLAELRRTAWQAPIAALTLYREIVTSGNGNGSGLSFPETDWQRRDDMLAVHTARALAAPAATEIAGALADRADSMMEAGRLEEAERDLDRALDLDPTVADVLRGLERLHQRRGDLNRLRERLLARVDRVSGPASAHLWLGIGRADEGLGDLAGAAAAYHHAIDADGTFRPAVTMMRMLASARGDFAQARQLLEKEIGLSSESSDRVGLLVDLGVLLATRLGEAGAAVDALDEALALEPRNVGALDAMFSAALGTGAWEKAASALETMLASGLALADTSQRYHRLGLAAEEAGQTDRALGLYSRSYARNPAFRPTLERLSEICFERQQWENAWKATEHLIDRHGAGFDPDTRAGLALRSALADLHVAQRLVAANRIAAMLPGPASLVGLRDVAESWASMRFDPRLLVGVDGDRRERVLSRLAEVSTWTHNNPSHPARSVARETLAALALVEERWADALSMLDVLAADPHLESERRCVFLICAGDILLHQQGDVAGAALRYQRARALNPAERGLARAQVLQVTGGHMSMPTDEPGGRDET